MIVTHAITPPMELTTFGLSGVSLGRDTNSGKIVDIYKNLIILITMKTASEFKLALEKAKAADLNPVREAVKVAITIVEKQMDEAIANPTNVSSSPVFGDKMPPKSVYKGSYNHFIQILNTELALSGWAAEERHSGDAHGHATFIVKMVQGRDLPGAVRERLRTVAFLSPNP